MSGDSTGQVLGATTTATGIAVLPNTGEGSLVQVLSYVVIALGTIVLVSFTATRLYKKSIK
jgi:hypothetical protein